MQNFIKKLPQKFCKLIEEGLWHPDYSIIEGEFFPSLHYKLTEAFPFAKMDCFRIYAVSQIETETLSAFNSEQKGFFEGTICKNCQSICINPSNIIIVGDYGIDSPIAIKADQYDCNSKLLYFTVLEGNTVWLEAKLTASQIANYLAILKYR